jgi:nitrite reductase/ring-hydroxylating ferredoxin subunit
MAFVDLRDVPRRLAQREAVAFVVRGGSVHALQSICAYAQSQDEIEIEMSLKSTCNFSRYVITIPFSSAQLGGSAWRG